MFLCIGVKKFSEPLQMSLTLHDYGLRSVSPLRASSDTYLRAAKTFFQVCFHLICGEKNNKSPNIKKWIVLQYFSVGI